MSIAYSKEEILNRIRAALQTAATRPEEIAEAYAAIPRNYARAGKLDSQARIVLMIERLREYDAEVVECLPEEVPVAIASQIKASGRLQFVLAPEIPEEWLSSAERKIDGIRWTRDHGLTTAAIEKMDGAITEAFCGIADSGTVVLHHSPREGRRVLTLLPDWHLCILRASQIVETLPEYFALSPDPPTLVTWISGPSATADIEMTRIKGVHGPRFFRLIVVTDLAG